MNILPPLREHAGSPGWSNFFTQLFAAVGWVKSWAHRFTLDFDPVAAHSESGGLTVTIKGARPGDAVNVTPYANTSGITYKALVTADDTVTIYAINYTAGAIDPASMQYRVVVIQN